jgi:hypothetical protein
MKKSKIIEGYIIQDFNYLSIKEMKTKLNYGKDYFIPNGDMKHENILTKKKNYI